MIELPSNLEAAIQQAEQSQQYQRSFNVFLSGVNSQTSFSGKVLDFDPTLNKLLIKADGLSTLDGVYDPESSVATYNEGLYNEDTYGGFIYSIPEYEIVVKNEVMRIGNAILAGADDKVYEFDVLERGMYGTGDSDPGIVGYKFRSAMCVTELVSEYKYKADKDLGSSLFSFALESGSLDLKVKDISKWSILSQAEDRYKFKSEKTIVHIFEGINNIHVKQYTGFGENLRQRGLDGIRINFKDKFYNYKNKEIDKVYNISDGDPISLFQNLLEIDEDFIGYSQGLTSDDFPEVGLISSKEFTTKGEIIDAYMKLGVRARFNAFEKLVLYCDVLKDTSTLTPINEDNYVSENKNIFSLEQNADNWKIINNFESTYVERTPLYDLDDYSDPSLNISNGLSADTGNSFINDVITTGVSNHVRYEYYTPVNGFDLIDKSIVDGYEFNKLNLIVGTDIQSRYVKFLGVGETYFNLKSVEYGDEFIGLVTYVEGADNGDVVTIEFGFDKDYTLYYADDRLDTSSHNNCKFDYLYNNKELLFGQSNFVAFVGRTALPEVWRFNREINGENKDSQMNLPIFPKISGLFTEQQVEDLGFEDDRFTRSYDSGYGGVDLEEGAFSGICQALDSVFEKEYTYDNGLNYGRDLEQGNEVPINAFVTRRKTNIPKSAEDYGKNAMPAYDDYTGEGFSIKFDKASSNEFDFKIDLNNNLKATITDYVEVNASKIVETAGSLIEVTSDVYDKAFCNNGIFLLKPTEGELNYTEKNQIYQKHKTNGWFISGLSHELPEDSVDGFEHFYIILNKRYPSVRSGTPFEFGMIDSSKMLYMQELYLTGNPVIEQQQTINNSDENSIEIHSKKTHSVSGNIMTKDYAEKFITYLLDNFATTTPENTKASIPVELLNKFEIEPFDIIGLESQGVNSLIGKFLVTSKEVSVDAQKRKESYILENLTDYTPTKSGLGIKEITSFSPKALPTFNHLGEDANKNPEDPVATNTEITEMADVFYNSIPKGKISAKVSLAERNEEGLVERLSINNFRGAESSEASRWKERLFRIGRTAVINIGGKARKVIVEAVERAT